MIMRILYTLILTNLAFISYAQLTIIGMNAETPDELLLLALDEIPAGETFHFTDNEYNSTLDAFSPGEGIISFSTNTIVTAGEVFSIKNDGGWSIEGTTDVTLGTVSGSLNFSLGDEQVYVYTTSDNTQSGSISTIIAMVDTWLGTISGSLDPTGNYPDAYVIDLLDNFRNLAYEGDREAIDMDDIMDLSNWNLASTRIDFDMSDFLNVIPVELTYFRASEISNGNLLQWETAAEFDNEKFVIEKSKNGYDFAPIDFLMGQGTVNVNQKYEYLDKSTSVGINYYRLKQVDFNGSFEYSNILILENKAKETVDVYPTLVAESINISLTSDQKNQLVIFDQTGRSIVQKVIENGNNVIDLSSLTRGAYFMTIYMQDGPHVEKFIKQ